MRTIASNALSIAIVKGAPVGSRVLLLLAMARLTSTEELARASYAIAIAEAVRVAAGGMELWAVRAIGRTSDVEAASQTTSAMALVKLVFGCAGAAVAVALTFWNAHGGLGLAAVAGCLVLAGEAFDIGLVHNLAQATPGRLVPVSITVAIVASVGSIAALVLGAQSSWVCAIIAGTEAAAAAFVLARLRAAQVLVLFPGIIAKSRSVVSEALPTTAYGAIVAIYARLDAIALNAFSATAFAAYTVAFRATQPFAFMFGAVALSVYSAQMSDRSRASSRVQFRKLLTYVFAAASVAALATYLACAWLIANVIPKYTDSLPALQVLCVMLPVVAVNNLGLYALAGQGMFKTLVSVVTMNLLSISILLWLLVPAYGATGAALSLLGCQLLNGLVLLGLLLKRMEPVPA